MKALQNPVGLCLTSNNIPFANNNRGVAIIHHKSEGKLFQINILPHYQSGIYQAEDLATEFDLLTDTPQIGAMNHLFGYAAVSLWPSAVTNVITPASDRPYCQDL